MPTLTPAQIRSADVFVNTAIMSKMRSVPEIWKNVATSNKIDVSESLYASLNDLPNIGRKEGRGYPVFGVGSKSFSLISQPFGGTIEISKQAYRDGAVGLYGKLPANFGKKMGEFPGDAVFALLKEGDQATGASSTIFAGQSIASPDGGAFFRTDHNVNGYDTAGGTQSNLLATGALTTTTFAVAYAALSVMKDQRGNPLNLVPNKLIVPPSLRAVAASVLQADAITTGVYNPNSNQALKAQGLPMVELVVASQLEGDSAVWYLAAVEAEMAPIIYQVTTELYITSYLAETDQNMRQDDMMQWTAKGEAAFGFADYRLIVRCNG